MLALYFKIFSYSSKSILDNIRMGNPNATEEQVIEAAKAAQCHEFISKLPNGYKLYLEQKVFIFLAVSVNVSLLLELLSKIPLLLFLMKQLHLATQKMSI